MKDSYKHSEITNLIIQAFFRVYNELKFGFLEKVYENSLVIALKDLGLRCTQQTPVDVYFQNNKVGYYLADIIVNSCVIVEIKSAESICEAHEAQLTNYLRATNLEVGLLLNFGKIPSFNRKVFTVNYKPNSRNK